MTELQHRQQLMAVIVASFIDRGSTIDIYNLVEDADKIVSLIIDTTKLSVYSENEHNDY